MTRPENSPAAPKGTRPSGRVLIRIDTASMREMAQRGQRMIRDASLSPEAQAYLNALEYWYLAPENSARGRKGR